MDRFSLSLSAAVASLAEAWIEISDIIYQAITGGSRLPRGGVD